MPAGATTVTVKVHQYPIPTAQISVFAFKDHMPINNIFDPSEEGIGGATVLIFDQLGQMSTDVFGNPLGTEYDSSGTIIRMGSGVIKTCTQSDVDQGLNYCTRVGEAFIKNLAPGKYGIRVVPPGNPSSYIQTSTIEGTPGIDAWVKANEPPLFIEGFGTGFYHVFIGFVYPAENGGISGIVYYATTRAENDPRYAASEPWEPGVPRVQVCLYRDSDGNGVIDALNNNGNVARCDVDNHPLGNFPGPEDIDRNGNGVFDLGDAIDVTWTDSWDDNKPTGCIQDLPAIPGVQPCFDNYGTWNQIRPGVFDGGYAFGFAAGKPHLMPGYYIVEAVPPPGYEIQKEEVKNVDFGDEYRPINRVQITGRDSSLFYTAGIRLPVTVVPGGSVDITVGFRSRPRGLKSAILKIYSNDPDTPILSVPLSGMAVR